MGRGQGYPSKQSLGDQTHPLRGMEDDRSRPRVRAWRHGTDSGNGRGRDRSAANSTFGQPNNTWPWKHTRRQDGSGSHSTRYARGSPLASATRIHRTQRTRDRGPVRHTQGTVGRGIRWRRFRLRDLLLWYASDRWSSSDSRLPLPNDGGQQRDSPAGPAAHARLHEYHGHSER